MLDSGWATHEVQGATFADKRFSRVMIEILTAKEAQLGVSFSSACGSALRQAAGRLLRHEETNPTDLLAGHRQATLSRCMGKDTIVVAQDSSSFNYSTHRATSGLGPINDAPNAAGIHQHSALAMTLQRFPLGVVDAHFWARSTEKQTAADRRKKPIEEKESFRWIRTTRHVEQLFGPYLHQGGQVVVVADREADIFDLLADERHSGLNLVIRASHPRNVVITDAPVKDAPVKDASQGSHQDGSCSKDGSCSLLEAAKEGELLGSYTICVPGKTKKQDHEAKMELRCCSVEIQPPRNGVGYSKATVPVRVVQAREVTPEGFTGVALEWIMITTLDVANLEAARRVIDLYACRWEIERLHYTLKSGCQAEHLQMDDVDTLCNTLALYLIVAWRLLYVTHLSRVVPDTPVQAMIDEAEVAVLNQQSRTAITTVSQAVMAIAKLGGFEPYKNGPPPGVKVLWLGLRKLEAMAIGWRLAMASIRQKM